MSKAERTELRALIRLRFRVLRGEVDTRAAELAVDLDAAIARRFADENERWSAMLFLIKQAVDEANRKANDILREHQPHMVTPGHEFEIVTARGISRGEHDPVTARRQGRTRIDAQVAQARQRLDQEEADLLTRLATDALESDAARTFLASIPTVAELVPADRMMRMLEQDFGGDGV